MTAKSLNKSTGDEEVDKRISQLVIFLRIRGYDVGQIKFNPNRIEAALSKEQKLDLENKQHDGRSD